MSHSSHSEPATPEQKRKAKRTWRTIFVVFLYAAAAFWLGSVGYRWNSTRIKKPTVQHVDRVKEECKDLMRHPTRQIMQMCGTLVK